MSGYAPDAILGRGIGDLGASLLPKPFTPDGMLKKVREMLTESAMRGDSGPGTSVAGTLAS
jgi:hypothetical protein